MIEAQLEAVRMEAHRLLTKHGLFQKGWRFQFDQARSRAGQCRYDKKIISMSQYFALHAAQHDVIDTILHEIAHALTPRRGHDRVWKQVAMTIGCTGERCHTVKFAKPKYLQQCVRGCWQREVHRRRKDLVCRLCKGPVVYVNNG